MKRLYLIILLMTCTFLGFSREYKVYGPQGGLAMEVTLPVLSFRMLVETESSSEQSSTLLILLNMSSASA